LDPRTAFAYDPADSAEMRIEKTGILIIAGASCVAGLLWSATYLLVFGWGVPATLPLVFVVIVGPALWISHRLRDHRWAVHAQIACIIVIPALLQWSIGGLFDSGFVIIWALSGPLVALFFLSLPMAMAWIALYAALVALTVVFDATFAAHGPEVTPQIRALFFLMNTLALSIVVFVFAGYSVNRTRIERERAERLLLNIIPEEIAPRLKSGEATIADHFDSATVLFADMVGSTPLFTELDADDAVDWLNEAFTAFDRLVVRHGVEKIRTIGDNYMVAAGVPTPRPDHAHALVRLGLDMQRALDQLRPRAGRRLVFRIGIHSGPVVAGVIGETKFQYDIWGDTVNTASRMESNGEPGRIQISEATYALVRDDFELEPRGRLLVKGKGELGSWWVVGENVAGRRSHVARVT
jgi:adenylate cyclase